MFQDVSHFTMFHDVSHFTQLSSCVGINDCGIGSPVLFGE